MQIVLSEYLLENSEVMFLMNILIPLREFTVSLCNHGITAEKKHKFLLIRKFLKRFYIAVRFKTFQFLFKIAPQHRPVLLSNMLCGCCIKAYFDQLMNFEFAISVSCFVVTIYFQYYTFRPYRKKIIICPYTCLIGQINKDQIFH